MALSAMSIISIFKPQRLNMFNPIADSQSKHALFLKSAFHTFMSFDAALSVSVPDSISVHGRCFNECGITPFMHFRINFFGSNCTRVSSNSRAIFDRKVVVLLAQLVSQTSIFKSRIPFSNASIFM